ncbi:MAG: hypothetical protein EPO31_01575 [Gammaproteobacteria bacterium]|nr:MAG: hypothetical protein EPO31_01575 [Gammaproteobacteria bacterium]
MARQFLLSVSLILALLPFWVHGATRIEDWRWSGVERVVAVADIHGAWDAFSRLLRQLQLVDDDLDWQGGATHLVIVGDVLDRGDESRRVLDLIMKLESEAPAAGGRVHMVLGNHEVMNLLGDLAYVSEGEYASYAADEDPTDRDAAWRRFKNLNSGKDPEAALKAEFNRRYPQGFFGHRRYFSVAGPYGKWLLQRPVLLQVDDSLFLHGGYSQMLLSTGVAAINRDYGETLSAYLEYLSLLASAGILPLESGFHDHSRILEAYLAGQAKAGTVVPADMQTAAREIIRMYNSPLFQPDSPIWYRGNVGCGSAIAESILDAALARHAAGRLVIGHTPTHNHQILTRFGGKLVRADTGMLSAHYGGQASAVIVEAGKVSAVYAGQSGKMEPGVQPRQVGARPDSLSDDELETLLSTAPVADARRQENGSSLLQLAIEGSRFDALYTPSRGSRYLPQVAAYRLDRLLGIDLAPVTVKREVGGTTGSLQVTPEALVSEPQRAQQREGGSAWCPLGEQFNLMYVFDILMYNEGRRPEEIRYTPGDWHLVLTGNQRTFAARNGRPRHLREIAVDIPESLKDRLAALDMKQLDTALGDVLDRKSLEAILKRRDLLLKSARP